MIVFIFRINPLFTDSNEHSQRSLRKHDIDADVIGTPKRYRSSSSGYSSSKQDSALDTSFNSHLKSVQQIGAVVEQNPLFVKSIRVATRGITPYNNKVPSPSNSSGGGTLTTIPEGKVDLPVPKPIWPLYDKLLLDHYDSLVDDALLLYTSFSNNPEKLRSMERYIDLSVKDLLLELINNINETLEGKNCTAPEEMLKIVNEKIRLKLEILKHSSEDEMRRLCENLSNCTTKKSVLRALSNSSSSGKSFTDSSSRVRTSSSETEDIYQVPSGSSSSGFSDSLKELPNSGVLPVFVHEDMAEVPNVIRNAMIYGTLCRTKTANGTNELLVNKNKRVMAVPKRSLLKAVHDDKPSVWEQYYGVKAVEEGGVKYATKPTDVPVFVSIITIYIFAFYGSYCQFLNYKRRYKIVNENCISLN